MIAISRLFEIFEAPQKEGQIKSSECPNFKGCPYCANNPISQQERIKMIGEFCKGDFRKCARYKVNQSGKNVPISLSPCDMNQANTIIKSGD